MGTKVEKDSVKSSVKYKPALGREFEAFDLDALSRHETTKTRNLIAKTCVFAALGAIIVSFIYSIAQGSDEAIARTWGVAGPFLGYVFGYYFRNEKGRDSG